MQSLARQLLRFEDGADPQAAAGAAADCAAIARATAGGPPAVARLAAALAAVTADLRDGRVARGPGLPEALIAAADALADALGLSGDIPDEAATDAALGELAAAVALASAAPAPGPAPAAATWPPPGGAVAPDLLAQFTVESLESLQEAEGALLELETQADRTDAVHRLFRAVHSIKGTAGSAGLNQISHLSHKLENVLALVRSGRLALAGATELVFQGVDHLSKMVGELTTGGEVSRDLRGFIAAIDDLCGRASATPEERDTLPGPADDLRVSAARHLDLLTDGLKAVAAGDCSDSVLDLLHRSATSIKTAARAASVEALSAPADELLAVLTRLRIGRDRLAAALAGSNPGLPLPAPAAAPASRTAPAAGPGAVPSAGPKSDPAQPAPGQKPPPAAKTMRVDQRKLDEYANLAGELVIARNSLVHVLKRFQADRSNARGLKDTVEKMCRIVGAVQTNAMGMRLVPVGTVFQRFPRLVRDVAKTLGKHIELDLQGEETELDRQVAEALSDPLVHLVRNAADHGIESPDARRAAGKREAGTITLRAGRDGNVIVIDIQDDGGGIDAERLKAKAVATGVITADQAAGMPRGKALELVFAAGLSTAQVVSDLSGRGVGMDVVKNNIAALGGTVSIRSEPGQGSCIRLALPLTLAVTTVVLVDAGGMTFGLPIDVVQETLKATPDAFHHLRGVRAVALRGDIIPVKPLCQLIGLTPRQAEADDDTGRVSVVVLAVAGTKFGVTVDGLKGQQEIVLKPVPPQLGHIDGVGGATIMGDGEIVLILDPGGLYRSALDSRVEPLPSAKEPSPGFSDAASIV